MRLEVIYKVSSTLTFTWSVNVLHTYEMINTITELLNSFSKKINKHSLCVLDSIYNLNYVNMLRKDPLQCLILNLIFTRPFFYFPNTDKVRWMLNHQVQDK